MAAPTSQDTDAPGHGHVLTPGRHVGAEDAEDDGVSFAERFAELRAKLDEQFRESGQLPATIRVRPGRVIS